MEPRISPEDSVMPPEEAVSQMGTGDVRLSRSTAALLAVGFLVGGFFVGRLSIAEPVSDKVNEATLEAVNEPPLDALGEEDSLTMEEAVPTLPPSNYPVDPEIQRGQQQAVELNEMICKQTGQNCEAAATARRHYEEKYGPM